jgi:hypothetical protein
MGPGKFPLTLYRGDSARWGFVLWADADKTIPADLVSVTPKAEVRDKPAGTKIVALDCVIILPNTITMTLTSDMARILPATGVWDLQLTYDDGDVATILAGSVLVTPDVTDSSLAVPTPSTLLVVPNRVRGAA